MNMSLMTDQIITDWQPHYDQLFGKFSLALSHRLASSELFSDEALASLIEKSPREAYHVNYSQKTPGNPPKRREGEIRGLSGREVLEVVRTGNIWVNIVKPIEVEPAYGTMLDALYQEFEGRVPGFRSYKRNLTILISSPNVSVKYHSDVPGQSLWQVRGTKTLYVYPAAQPFISQPALEKLILGQLRETDMPYEPWFDDFAETHVLEAGKMIHWPLNGPHRVVNSDMMNVSFTTEHWTDELRKHYAVNYANGVLRSATGARALSQQVTGLSYYSKLALAGAVKFSPLNPQKKKVYTVDFRVDPSAPEGVRDIESYQFSK